MTLHELKLNLEPLLMNINESTSSNISEIKRYLKQYVFSNKKNIKAILPQLKQYISSLRIDINIKKNIIKFLSILLLSIGYPALSQDVKNTPLTTIDVKNINYIYDYVLGEYFFDEKGLKEYIKSYTNKGNKVKGTITVSISRDLSAPKYKNYANDDTYEEKLKGGKLLDKRINKVKELINNLQKEVSPIILDIQVKGIVSNDRKITVSNFNAESKEEDTYPIALFNIDDSNDNNNIDLPSGGSKDITTMSRNLQFIELLKIVDIDAKPFFNNDIKKGDEYSRWIVNVRKNIKSFFSRLKEAYPDYDITYNVNAKVKTDISGARRGVSHLKNQYIQNFESFRYDNITKKWRKILGITFPYMTEELAYKFDENIEKILDMLEKMYGTTLLQFNYTLLKQN